MSARGSGAAEDPASIHPANGLLFGVRQFYDIALSWHGKEPAACANGGITAHALHLHAMNFGLWHHKVAVRR